MSTSSAISTNVQSGTGTMAVSGLVSGINTSSMIAQLQQLAQQPVTNLQNQVATLQNQISAWNTANTTLASLGTAATQLATAASTPAYTATSSDSSVSVSTSGAAVPGSYSFTVQSVAAYQQLSTQGYTSQNSSLGTGSITLASNNKSTTINMNGMTLQGLRDAINTQSDVGVKAIIVSDGATSPTYRLMLTSQTLGSAGAINVTSTLPSATAPVMQTLQPATDTVLNFGSSTNGSTFNVSRSSQTISDVIPGVTLAVNAASVGKTVSVNVQQSTNNFTNALQNFISQYNSYVDFAAQQNAYDPTTNASGTLFGEYTLTAASSDVIDTLDNPVAGLPSTMNSVIQIGLSLDANGKLTLDNTAFSAAMASNPQGVEQLFSTTGTSANQNVTYSASTSDTQASGSGGYDVQITQAATQGHLTLATALPSVLTNDETLTLNGATVALKAGMTQSELLQAINAQTSISGVTASLTGAVGTGSGNNLTLTNSIYGAQAHISVVSDHAGDGYLGIGQTAITETAPGTNLGTAGLDVQGTINGQAATGNGQLLTSSAGSSTGLQLLISGTTTGDLGPVVFSQGIGSTIANMLTTFTDPTTGSIQSKTASLTTETTNLNSEITNMNASITQEMTRTQNEFNAMEVALGQLQSQSAQMTSLLAGLSTSSTGA